MDEKLQLRIYGDDSLPTLIYLPGLHGDWTLVGSFRKQVARKVRFVEMTYPRTLVWSLDDYAAEIETALAENKISNGWLLGESFGSQPLWAIVGRKKFQADGIILAGGVVRLPMCRALQLAERVAGRIALALVTQIIFPVTNRMFAWLYTKLARCRFHAAPETLAKISEFLERRTPLDFKAAQSTGVPIFALSGWFDPLVPWFSVRRWLRKNCPALRDYKIIQGDHAALVSAPKEAARQILEWIL